MQEETKRAVETALGVGFFGGATTEATLPLFALALGLPWLLSPSLTGPPSFHTPASQRMVRC